MASKRKKPISSIPGDSPTAAGASGIPQAYNGSGYTAADSSTMRGMIYFPNLDSKTNLTHYTRVETSRKARWLEGNMGIGRHFANTIPRLVGPLTPQPSTSDDTWNEAALAFFNRTQGSRMIHDQSGMESFYTRQRTIVKRGIVDGDCFVGLTTTTAGNARTVLYEAPQIGNGVGMNRENGWFDGVKIDRYGKKIAYSILEAGTYERVGIEVPARQLMHCGKFESPQSPRGLTAFIHAINRMLDIRQIDNDTLRGIKAANLVGFYLTNEALSNIDAAPAAGRFKTAAFNGIANTNVPDPKPIKYEELTQGGGNMMTLNQGQDIKTVNDSRRHPNQQAVINYFIEDCAWGFGMPPAILWSIASLTGPAVRFVMRMAEKTLKEYRDNLKEQFCQPYWVYTMALAQKNGQLPQCKDQDWWKCNWIAPSALTIDAGRDSAAGIKEIQSGGQTLQDWYGEDGDDWRKQLEQIAKERAYAAKLEKEAGLPPGTIMGERELNMVPQNPTQNPTPGA